MMLATRAPIVIPGQADLPSKMIRANAIPEGGHVGRAVVFSKAKKYPSLAER
jgi:hypothetical protein